MTCMEGRQLGSIMASWVEHAVWWQVFPLGFVGAERKGTGLSSTSHRLGHINAWFDYALELGVSGIALGPIFASSTHGYDTINHFRIDPRLGNEADFDRLVEAAKARGLRILLDGVFNHVGRDFPAFQEVLAKGPTAPKADWFKLCWPNGTNGEPDYGSFEGHKQLVSLNHDQPAIADYVRQVMEHWLGRGVDGWRLDAAYAVPTGFWAKVLPQVRSRHPDAYFVGEVIHGDYAQIVRESGMDAVTQYELWKAIWSSIKEFNFFELDWTLRRHNGFLDSFKPLIFVGNHDVTRIASLVGRDRLKHAIVLLFTLGGTPAIYYGDEQAYTGLKEEREGRDDDIRPLFPQTPDQLAPFGKDIYQLHQEMIGIRRRHPWLHSAKTDVLHLRNAQLFLRCSKGSNELFVALNLAGQPAIIPAPGVSHAIAGEAHVTEPGGRSTEVRMPPNGWAVFEGRSGA
jgi:cyclomaltodextrinase / maltogenic alpha-amylase / neopullulanase